MDLARDIGLSVVHHVLQSAATMEALWKSRLVSLSQVIAVAWLTKPVIGLTHYPPCKPRAHGLHADMVQPMRPVCSICPMSSMGQVLLESTTPLTPLMRAMESTTVRLDVGNEVGEADVAGCAVCTKGRQRLRSAHSPDAPRPGQRVPGPVIGLRASIRRGDPEASQGQLVFPHYPASWSTNPPSAHTLRLEHIFQGGHHGRPVTRVFAPQC